MRVVLVKPRGFCAGVERAVEIVERALELFPAPIYVRKEIVHNSYVVDNFRKRGVIFVDELTQVPSGELVIFSAHGISPAVREDARARRLRTIDATCPLVTKVHMEVHRFDRDGYSIVLIGHKGHEEVEGTMGERPGLIKLVTCVEDVNALEVENPHKLVYLTQTTLSVDETLEVVAALKKKFPEITSPPNDDICYATQNRQNAVKELTQQAEVVLVVGVSNSSNSVRLTEVARAQGARSYLVAGPQALQPEWFAGVQCVGVTAGASAPEVLVQGVVDALRSLGASAVEELNIVEEDVKFALPRELQLAMRAAALPA